MVFEAFDFDQKRLHHFVHEGLKATYKNHVVLVLLFAATMPVHLFQKMTNACGWEFLDHYIQVANHPK